MGKFLCMVLIIAYIISPIDLMPGVPIDDIIIALIGVAASQKKQISN